MNHAPLNQGDDVAGIVAAVGPEVTHFKVGDRVAALHQPGTEWGTYAEYCIVWSYAAFKLPEDFDLAEASTFGVAALTAAVGLYRVLGLPFPEGRGSASTTKESKRQPVIIYGASSAVGAFAIKLASLGGLHPIVAIAGAGSPYVRTLLDEAEGDIVLDYRSGENEIVEAVANALKSEELVVDLAFDTVPTVSSQRLLGKLLVVSESTSGHGTKHLATVLPPPEVDGFPEGKVRRTFVMSTIVFQDAEGGDKEVNHAFGKKAMDLFGDAVHDGKLSGHPYEIIPGGLDGVELGLKKLQRGENSAKKYVYEIEKA